METLAHSLSVSSKVSTGLLEQVFKESPLQRFTVANAGTVSSDRKTVLIPFPPAQLKRIEPTDDRSSSIDPARNPVQEDTFLFFQRFLHFVGIRSIFNDLNCEFLNCSPTHCGDVFCFISEEKNTPDMGFCVPTTGRTSCTFKRHGLRIVVTRH